MLPDWFCSTYAVCGNRISAVLFTMSNKTKVLTASLLCIQLARPFDAGDPNTWSKVIALNLEVLRTRDVQLSMLPTQTLIAFLYMLATKRCCLGNEKPYTWSCMLTNRPQCGLHAPFLHPWPRRSKAPSSILQAFLVRILSVL
jgi:hypothetical protein